MKNSTSTIIISILVLLMIAGGFGSAYFYIKSGEYRNASQEADKEQQAIEKDVEALKKENSKAKKEIDDLKKERDKLKDQGQTGKVPKEALTGHASESGFMIVTRPQIDDVINSPTQVTGKAIAFESTVNIRIKDDNGKILKESTVMTTAADVGKFGTFSIKISFNKPSTKKGTLEAFESSARDGSEVNKVIIPIVFQEPR